MFTFRNMFALGLFLFGTTFLWMTASFAGTTPPPKGTAWSIVNVFALVAVAAFTVAASGVFKDHQWWQAAALGAAIVGVAAVIPYVVGLRQTEVGLADPGVQINLWMHVLGSAAVIALVAVPAARDWVTGRL